MLLDAIKSALKTILSSTDYQNEYGTTCVTEKGEKVKSKAEKQIADYLYSNNFRYQYEKPALTRGIWIFHDKISNPDFYLLDFDVYIEYWGLLNARDYKIRDEYERVMKWKMAQYHENNIKFISLYPANLNNLDWVFKTKLREVVGVEFQVHSKAKPTIHKGSPEASPNLLEAKTMRQLGKYYDKLRVSSSNEGLQLYPKQWLKREEWDDINEILRPNGFRWQSNGKDSCWAKKQLL